MRTSITQLCEAVKHRPWRVTKEGQIRNGRSNNCPLVAAAMDLNYAEYRAGGGSAGEADYEGAAGVIGFRGDDVEFTNAVDYTLHDIRNRWFDQEGSRLIRTRKKVFKLLGLPEAKL